jgi:hypothetical protein
MRVVSHVSPLISTHTPKVLPRGKVTIVNFPLSGRSPLPDQVEAFQIPTHWSRSGVVRVMEWTSDGYALAVGWEKGWAVWSVGGRCLVWASGTEYDPAMSLGIEPSQTKLQDLFMKGVASLVSIPLILRVAIDGLIPPRSGCLEIWSLSY